MFEYDYLLLETQKQELERKVCLKYKIMIFNNMFDISFCNIYSHPYSVISFESESLDLYLFIKIKLYV